MVLSNEIFEEPRVAARAEDGKSLICLSLHISSKTKSLKSLKKKERFYFLNLH